MEYGIAKKAEQSPEFLVLKEEVSIPRTEILALKADNYTLYQKIADAKILFFKIMIGVMYVPCLIAVIIFVMRELRR